MRRWGCGRVCGGVYGCSDDVGGYCGDKESCIGVENYWGAGEIALPLVIM